MRPVLLALSLASLLCIAAAVLGLQQANPFSGQQTPLWQTIVAQLVLVSAHYFSFAAGVTALVIMGQCRQWRWFATMLGLVLVAVYGPVVVPALPLPSSGQQPPLLAVFAQRYLIYPSLAPLALLFYRPFTWPRPGIDSPLDLDVTPLTTPHETSPP